MTGEHPEFRRWLRRAGVVLLRPDTVESLSEPTIRTLIDLYEGRQFDETFSAEDLLNLVVDISLRIHGPPIEGGPQTDPAVVSLLRQQIQTYWEGLGADELDPAAGCRGYTPVIFNGLHA